jgi:hypothetical protein
MAKRISRRRLFALNKKGELLTQTAGAGISDSIGQSSRLRSGTEIISEITIDLANGTAPADSYGLAGAAAAATHAIGVSSSAVPHDNAQLLQIDYDSVAGTINGVVTSGELICIETPAGGEDNIGLWYGDNISGSGANMADSGVELIAAANQVITRNGTFDTDTTIDDKYLYLVASGSTAGTYTSGKFVLRLYGYSVFPDVS